jgi:hypothetical protein
MILFAWGEFMKSLKQSFLVVAALFLLPFSVFAQITWIVDQGKSDSLDYFEDVFTGTVVNEDKWTIETTNWGVSVSQDDELIISGVSIEPSLNWKAQC